ncbi:MAG: tRNA (adenosine(37)-N6)-threonylcarbamoyltransferase complex ATPase subunit type 1 TsaE [Prevotella sp.]|nr:tRNA (adenosine(37)-N6)-threonylcarbamoyltransferase complex ATPase subunit type 1 TsaE [Prevotella sp.]MBR7048930.1 tRNA (adenosine(37)-N6)-threonylcarbamoyltransferase complex ATPase subunit type 1 TsaE [Prevotella sp.]
MKIIIHQLDEIRNAARQFIEQALKGDCQRVVAFYGSMGAGKTTFIRALCEELGVTDVVTSPTFAIVNEYEVDSSSITRHPSPITYPPASIFHFDFYRIKRLEEVYDMGYEDYFYGSSLCLIEWPELIEELLPDDCLRVNIRMLDDGSREISVRQ